MRKIALAIMFVLIFAGLSFAEPKLYTEDDLKPYQKKEQTTRISVISVDFKDAPIWSLLNFLKDIVSGDGFVLIFDSSLNNLTGVATFKMTNKPWFYFLHHIAQKYNLKLDVQGNIIVVSR